MKNKNIKNKPQNVIDGFSCILDFPKFSGGGPEPLIKGIHQLNPQNPSSMTTTAKGKKKKKKRKESQKAVPHLKTIYKKLTLGYTETEKRRRALGQDFFV